MPDIQPTRAISIIQPWAWLITMEYKLVENRTWPTEFRGPVYIHASKKRSRLDYVDAACKLQFHCDGHAWALPDFADFVRGALIGTATIR